MQQANGSAGYRVLVVDDEEPVLRLMTEILSERGWTIEAFSSPVRALERAKRQRFDVLVLDLYMPELPGMLFHAKLSVFDSILAKHTLFVTGHFSREELRQDLEKNAAVLLKPFEPSELAATVERLLPARPRAA
jgi:two-component system CheB/CheR fusion protein